jgi:chromosome segregation ATPase
MSDRDLARAMVKFEGRIRTVQGAIEDWEKELTAAQTLLDQAQRDVNTIKDNLETARRHKIFHETELLQCATAFARAQEGKIP